MSARPPLTCRIFLLRKDGTAVPFEELTEQERKEWGSWAGDKMAKSFQGYFAQNPEKF